MTNVNNMECIGCPFLDTELADADYAGFCTKYNVDMSIEDLGCDGAGKIYSTAGTYKI